MMRGWWYVYKDDNSKECDVDKKDNGDILFAAVIIQESKHCTALSLLNHIHTYLSPDVIQLQKATQRLHEVCGASLGVLKVK